MTLPSTATPTTPPPPAKRGNGFGIAALVLGIIALVLSLIPFVGYGSWVLALLAIIFGIIGLTRKLAPKTLSAIGLVLGIVALILGFVISIAATSAVVTSVDHAVNKVTTHTITYSVTGDGKNADVTYYSFQGDTSKSVQHSQRLPFTKTVTVKEKGSLNFNSFSVTANYPISSTTGKQLGKHLACTVKVDGKVKGTDTASGSGAVVSCSGSAG